MAVRPKVVVATVAVDAMVTLAVTDVAVAAVIVPVTPGSPPTTALAAARFVPVNVTASVVPAAAVAGLTAVKVGTAALTVKLSVTVLLPTTSPRVVTPAVAVGLIVIEAVTLVAETDVMVPLTPGLLDVTAEAALKSEPVKVTEKLLPSVPLVVLTDVSVGVAAALTVKLAE